MKWQNQPSQCSFSSLIAQQICELRDLSFSTVLSLNLSSLNLEQYKVIYIYIYIRFTLTLQICMAYSIFPNETSKYVSWEICLSQLCSVSGCRLQPAVIIRSLYILGLLYFFRKVAYKMILNQLSGTSFWKIAFTRLSTMNRDK